MKSNLQRHRATEYWKCKICNKVIVGKRNTIHLGVLSHMKKHKKNNE